MAYATLDDLVGRYGEAIVEQLTDRTIPPSRAIDPAVAQSALDGASAEADSYVGVRWATPLTQTPDALREAVTALACERLHTAGIPEDVAEAAKRARAWLRDLAAGRAVIDAAGPAIGGDAVFVAGLPALFSAADMGGW